jgi:oxygen-dependent protoporphyrinogen oxidase
VIGGGITGLAAAYRLSRGEPPLKVVLFESASRLGGVLETVRRGGFLFEKSADNFVTAFPWAMDLCRRIGFLDQLIPTNREHRRALIVLGDRLHEVPEGFFLMAPRRIWPMLTTRILSWRGKLRLLCECCVPRKSDLNDESLASFAKRRLGHEAYERLVQPLSAGIYTADPQTLSMHAAFPQFVQMERQYGSLLRAVRKRTRSSTAAEGSESGARYGLFVAPREGMSSLVDAVAAALPGGSIQTETTVTRVERTPHGQWSLATEGRTSTRIDADAVIFATPASAAARLIDNVDPQLAQLLDRISHASCAVVSLGFRKDQFGRRLGGFGFVVPQTERRSILAGSFSSIKYPGRAPEGMELVRVFIGGASHPELVESSDAELVAIACGELAELLAIRGDPVDWQIARWHNVMPQYCVGHAELVSTIEARVASLGGVALAGNAYRGVGIPQCILSGEEAAARIAEYLRS